MIKILKSFIIFSRNSIGCLNSPYTTYRKITKEQTELWQILFIYILIIAYFLFASLIRTGIRNPFLSTIKFNSLMLISSLSFAGIIFVFYIFSRIFSGVFRIKTIIILWSYSLLPTIVWFFFTSIMYLLFPPPRTFTFWGKLYSLFFISISLSLLWWKSILYYLTLRFGLRFDLLKIILITFFIVPAIAVYSLVTYKLGLLRIPFI